MTLPAAADLLRFGAEATLSTSLAIVLVLLLRRPLRRVAGARLAYLAWALVPLAVAAVVLPGPLRATFVPELVMQAPQRLAAVTVGAAMPLDAAGGDASSPSARSAWLLAWGVGALALAWWFGWQQRRFVSRLGIARDDGGTAGDGDRAGDDRPLRARHGDGTPAVIGALRPRIVLPRDFEARWDAGEAALILAHERAHVARGDTRANLLATALRCVFWFNPLPHLAMRAFRHDQELACDAAVLAAHPFQRRTYAGAMLKTQLAVPGLPVGCHWQSSQSLKERILMLKSPLPGKWRRRAGMVAVGCMLAGGSVGAWALQAPASGLRSLQYSGSFNDRSVGVLTVARADLERLRFSGPAMGGAQDGDVFVLLDRDHSLEVTPEDGGGWRLVVDGAGSINAPALRWRLEVDGRAPVEGGQAIGADVSRLDLAGATGVAALPGFTVARLPEDRVFPQVDVPLEPQADGSWMSSRTLLHGGDFAANGEVMLVAELDAKGGVRDVRVESSSPRGLMSGVQATQLLANNRYAAVAGGGSLEGQRVRVPVGIWRDPVGAGGAAVVASSERGAPTARPESGADMPTAIDTPAPAYPAQAKADRVGGHVLLYLLVATDGSVKDAKVATSSPAGVFDQASIDAARKWTLTPKLEGGKPVEGWVQVPITFEPDDPPAAGEPGDRDSPARRG